MSKFARMMDVMDLFSDRLTLSSAEGVARLRNGSMPTAFRYARGFCADGFWANESGTYSMGARVIRHDQRTAGSDPVLRVTRPVMLEPPTRPPATSVPCQMSNKDIINA